MADFDSFCTRLQANKEVRLDAKVYLDFHSELQSSANIDRLFESVVESTSLEAICLDHVLLRGQDFSKLLRPSLKHITSKWASENERARLLTCLPTHCPCVLELVIVSQQPMLTNNDAWIDALKDSGVQNLTIRVTPGRRSGATDLIEQRDRAMNPLAQGIVKSSLRKLAISGVDDSALVGICKSVILSNISSLTTMCKTISQAHAIREMLSEEPCPVKELILLPAPILAVNKDEVPLVWTELALGLGSNSSLEKLDFSRLNTAGLFSSNIILQKSLHRHARLKSLVVSQCRLPGCDVVALVRNLPENIESLDICCTQFSCSAVLMPLLTTMLHRSKELRNLNLRHSCLVWCMDDARALCNLLLHGNLQKIELGHVTTNQFIRDEALESVLHAVTRSVSIKNIQLAGLADIHSHQVLNGLALSATIETLRLRDSSLTSKECGLALKRVAEQSKLIELDLAESELGDAALYGLATGITSRECELQTLRLHASRKLSRSSLRSLLRALGTNTRLRVLQIRGEIMCRNSYVPAKPPSWWTLLCEYLPIVNLRTLIVDEPISAKLTSLETDQLLHGMKQNFSLLNIFGLSSLPSGASDLLNFWLKLNRAGRCTLWSEASAPGYIAPVLSRVSDDASALYYFVRQSNCIALVKPLNRIIQL